jgi:3-deoxy-D-manno-octulosonic-acid transferase
MGMKILYIADMICLYSILLFLVMMISLPVYFVRLRIVRNENLHLPERIGWRLPEFQSSRPSLWIHAVSVGEVLSLRNLIAQIKEQHPDWLILLSTLTESGHRIAKKKLTGIDHLFYVPLDFAVVVKKFFRVYHPRVFILAESEFWPNLIRTARQCSRGVLLINGRISDKSYSRFKRFSFIIRWIIQPVHCFLVQTEQDQQRLQDIGVDVQRIGVAGNLKAEIKLPDMPPDKIRLQKEALHIRPSDKVIIGGSTHKGEDKFLLEVFARIVPNHPELRFILAPRHPSRIDELERISQELGLKSVRRTQVNINRNWQVLFLDTFGELGRLYSVCDNAFIGGSLVPHGGQNLLEPAYYGKPVHFGRHMNNFSHIADLFVSSGAAKIVENRGDCREMFLAGEASLRARGETARRVLNSLQGATQVTLAVIEKHMSGIFTQTIKEM